MRLWSSEVVVVKTITKELSNFDGANLAHDNHKRFHKVGMINEDRNTNLDLYQKKHKNPYGSL